MNITTVGIDLAKDIITIHQQDTQGHCVLSHNFKLKELAEWLVKLPAECLIGIEACSTALIYRCPVLMDALPHSIQTTRA